MLFRSEERGKERRGEERGEEESGGERRRMVSRLCLRHCTKGLETYSNTAQHDTCKLTPCYVLVYHRRKDTYRDRHTNSKFSLDITRVISSIS